MRGKIKWMMVASAAAILVPLSLAAAPADVLRLLTDGKNTTSGSIGIATFSLTDTQPTGTGYIDPFLRMQAGGQPYDGAGVESGYNTDLIKQTQDDMMPHNYTHSVLAADLGTGTWKFLLDANQVGNANDLGLNLTLSKLQLFLSAEPLPGELGKLANNGLDISGLANVTMVYDMDAGNQDNQVNFLVQNSGDNHLGQNGSGSGDLYISLPAQTGGKYLTLYAEFGNGVAGGQGVGNSYLNYPNNDGFEEFAFVNVPDASATLMLLGMGLMGLEGLRRKLHA